MEEEELDRDVFQAGAVFAVVDHDGDHKKGDERPWPVVDIANWRATVGEGEDEAIGAGRW